MLGEVRVPFATKVHLLTPAVSRWHGGCEFMNPVARRSQDDEQSAPLHGLKLIRIEI